MRLAPRYSPTDTPYDLRGLRGWIAQELRRIADALYSGDVTLPVLTLEPERPSNGMLVYADGVEWNPGSGEGFYGYEAGAWTKL